jgi:hypothetical protein
MEEAALVRYMVEVGRARASCLVLADELDSVATRLNGVIDLESCEILSGISHLIKDVSENLKDLGVRISDEVG